MISKALFVAAIALCAAMGTATPANADPNWFNTLSCGCEPAALNGPTVTEQVNAGIQDGFMQLQDLTQ